MRRLVADQFPQWSDLAVTAVAHGGWDNQTFHLGSTMSVRLPSAAEYALAVEKEQHWLPRLAPSLPLPIPTVLGAGEPGAGYPFRWSIYGWLDGDPIRAGRITDPVRFALDLADFLVALQRVDTTGGPPPGTHSWFRGGTLRTFDETTQNALHTLEGQIDVELAREIWRSALESPWDGVTTWFHGDVAEGNLLLCDGQLSAVIDFGTCGVGDPSCDLAATWTLLTPESRPRFRERLSVTEASWARGRGWALWRTLADCARSVGEPAADANAWRVLDEICSEYEAASPPA